MLSRPKVRSVDIGCKELAFMLDLYYEEKVVIIVSIDIRTR